MDRIRTQARRKIFDEPVFHAGEKIVAGEQIDCRTLDAEKRLYQLVERLHTDVQDFCRHRGGMPGQCLSIVIDTDPDNHFVYPLRAV